MSEMIFTRSYLIADVFINDKYSYPCLFEGSIPYGWNKYESNSESIYAVAITENEINNPNPAWYANNSYICSNDICDFEDVQQIIKIARENESDRTAFKNIRFITVNFSVQTSVNAQSAEEILSF